MNPLYFHYFRISLSLWKKQLEFWWDCIASVGQFGKDCCLNSIKSWQSMNLICLCIYLHLHWFFFFNVLQFIVYKSCTLANFIRKYFILFWCLCKWHCFLNFIFGFFVTGFCILILYLSSSLNWFINCFFFPSFIFLKEIV